MAHNRSGLVWMLTAGGAEQAGVAVNHFTDRGYLTRLLRGKELETEGGMFREFAATLQFPWYFGQNWHAFDECFGEIEGRDVGAGLALVVMNGEAVASGSSDALRDLVTSLGYARDAWGESGHVSSLVVVVQMSDEGLTDGRAAWEAAGVYFDEFVAG